jgi:hypothetical protein
VAPLAADTAFDQAVTFRTALQFQSDFSLRAWADDHFDSFLEQFRLRPGPKERGKLAECPTNLKPIVRSLLAGLFNVVNATPTTCSAPVLTNYKMFCFVEVLLTTSYDPAASRGLVAVGGSFVPGLEPEIQTVPT